VKCGVLVFVVERVTVWVPVRVAVTEVVMDGVIVAVAELVAEAVIDGVGV